MSTDLRDQLQDSLGSAYRVERELGGGGMSRVYVAEEIRFRRSVVVKVLAPELAAGVNAERFEREIQLAASLQQANIVPVLSAGETAGLPYYTMPFVEGESLRAHLATRGALPMAEVDAILRDVARALAYAHERGVVHRDIKPDNVLLSGGTAVVTDFGIAKALSASKTGGDAAPAAPAATLTQLGTSLGTPSYMAPEQAAGDPETDHRADIYAFGCMAYELLTGRTPFHDRPPQRMLAAHLTEAPASVRELRPDTPPELAALVMRCLAKEPAARPASVGEILSVLATATGATSSRSASWWGRGMTLRRAVLVYAAACIAVAVVAETAVVGLGLPDWVRRGAFVIMALALPLIVLTGYAQQPLRRERAGRHLTWRRVGLGGAGVLGAFIAAVGGFMLLRALGIGPAGSLLAAGKLAASGRVLVTDFHASGTDSSLARVAAEAVRTDLGQSRAVTIVPIGEVADALQRMRKPPTSRVDLALARAIAAREGIEAVVDGDITALGSGMVVSVRLLAASSGDELAAYQETVDRPTELIGALDHLSRQLRGKIGESLRAVRATPPLAQVTTPSLEALRKYVAAEDELDLRDDYAGAIGLLREALELDTAFAMAYRKLGIAYGNGGYPEPLVDSALADAYRFRDRLTDSERLLAIGTYYGNGPGADREKAAAAYEEELRLDPRNNAALNNLGRIYVSRRELPKAEAIFRRLVTLGERQSGTSYRNLLTVLVDEGKLSTADSVWLLERERFPDLALVDFHRLPALYARAGADSVMAVLQPFRSSNNPVKRLEAEDILSGVLASRGRLRESLAAHEEVRAMNVARGVSQLALEDTLLVAMDDIWLRGRAERGIERLEAALGRSSLDSIPLGQRPYVEIATLYALAGRASGAQHWLARFDAEVRDTVRRRSFEPGRHIVLALVALDEHRPADALAELRLADTMPDGPAGECTICLDPLRAMAYGAAGAPDSAIAALEHYIATPEWDRYARGVDGNWLAFTFRRLGELYEAKSDRDRAAAYYQKFVDLWKNADADLQPQVAEVRRRLARLEDAERRS